MIDHIVIFRLKDDASDADVEALIDALYAFSRIVDGVVSYRLGRDAGLREGNDDMVLVASFRDEESFRTYMSHPRHLEVLGEYAPRLLADKHSVQLVSDEPLTSGPT